MAKEDPSCVYFLFFWLSHTHSLCVSWLKKILIVVLCSHTCSLCLTAKENPFYFFSLSHTNFLSQRQHFALSSLAFFSSSFSFPRSSLWLSLFMRHLFVWYFETSNKTSKHTKNLIFSLCFTLYISFPHRENTRAKVIKFFVILSIYKTLFYFLLN